MGETALGILLVVVILATSAFITHAFARLMYNRCSECGTLNARRRIHCRHCGQALGA
ncbi:hypothetical protein MYX82_09235 [Acidobacteria bacterium AH-259-D05]|nr:hypothetical protein [Acidobacteria bacterium AH-259-D05]